jgi:hypothetical protein
MNNEFDICENVHHNKVIYKGLFILPLVLGTHSFFPFELFIKLTHFLFWTIDKTQKWGFFLKTNHIHPQVITIVFILITL